MVLTASPALLDMATPEHALGKGVDAPGASGAVALEPPDEQSAATLDERWGEFLAVRAGGRRLRAGLSPVIAAGVIALTGSWLLLAWVLVIFAVMAADARIFRDLRRSLAAGGRPDTPFLMSWTAFQAALWVVPAWALWGVAPFGDAICFLVLASVCMQSAVSLRAAPRLVAAACAPLLIGMIAAPLALGFEGRFSLVGLLATAFSVLLLGLFTFGAFVALRRADLAREQALEAARQAQEAAEAADRAKADFLLLLSEELRTPAAALSAAGQGLRAELPEAARVQLGAMLDASEVLSGVLDDVLAAPKAGPGEVAGRERETDLRLLLRYAVEAWRGRARERWLELFLDVDPEVPERLLVDPVRFKQVIFALLAYAVEGVRNGGVRVRALAHERAPQSWDLAITITDDVVGVGGPLRESAWALASRAVQGLRGELLQETQMGEPVAVTLRFQARAPQR